MKFSYSKSYEITFNIQTFWDEEGGMGSDTFISRLDTIEQAIRMLEQAQLSRKSEDWIITCDVAEVKK